MIGADLFSTINVNCKSIFFCEGMGWEVGITWWVRGGEGRMFLGEGRVREIKFPGGMGMGTTMCSHTGLY